MLGVPAPMMCAAPRVRRLTVAVAATLAAIIAAQSWLIRLGGYAGGRYALVWIILGWWVLTGVAVLLLRRVQSRRVVVLLVVAGTVALSASALTRNASQLSDDLYRYAWDGRVQAAGIDPYRYPPTDEHLRGLRDAWLFPDAATCRQLGDQPPGCTRINRAGVPTIYPPVAQAAFTAVHFLPGPARDHKWQLYASVISLGLVGLLIRFGRDPALAACYAWSPLAGIDVAADGHVDALAALLAVGGLVLMARTKRHAIAGGLVGAAIAVKLYPALVLPAALRRRPVVVGAAAGGVFAVSYLPHLLATGGDVLGYLPGYLHEDGYSSGSRFLLLQLVGLPGSVARFAAGLILAVVTVTVTVAVRRSRLGLIPAALTMAGAAHLVVTPAAPWYGVLLAALAVLAARPEWLAVCAAAYPLYVAQLLRAAPALVGATSYAVAAAAVAGVTMWRRARRSAGQRDRVEGASAHTVATPRGGQPRHDPDEQVTQPRQVGLEDPEDPVLGDRSRRIHTRVEIGDQGDARVADGKFAGQRRFR